MTVVGRVLLLDSHARFRRTLARNLRAEGLACDAAGDPAEAAALLRRGRHDVLVIDVRPAANRGLLLGRDAPPATVPVVTLARRPSVESAVAALRVRAVEYLSAPIRVATVVASVRSA